MSQQLLCTLNPVDLHERHGSHAAVDLAPCGGAQMNAGCRAIGGETSGDVHSVAPDVEAELLPADDACDDGANVDADPQFPACWQSAGRIDGRNRALDAGHAAPSDLVPITLEVTQ